MSIVVPVVGDQATAAWADSVANWINTEDTYLRGREKGIVSPTILNGTSTISGAVVYSGTYATAPAVFATMKTSARVAIAITAQSTTGFSYFVFTASGNNVGLDTSGAFNWIAFL